VYREVVNSRPGSSNETKSARRHVVERAMTIYENFSDRQHADIVQARKALTRHVYGLICSGETSSQRLTVSGLAHLKQLEKERQAG
jgi:hypothetical protein